MAYLSELDVINDMLATLGESPLNDLSEDHPLVAAGRRTLRVVSTREQAKKWWFNTELLTLTPDPDKNIYVPGDTISVDTKDSRDYAQRGRRLYNLTTGSYQFNSKVSIRLVREIPFEDLPVSAADYIATAAILSFCSSYDADQAKVRQLKEDRSIAWATLNAEHIRYKKTNLLNRQSTANKLNSLVFNVPGAASDIFG
ncbi:tail protein [Caulobacter phage Lullwater]|uniref:Tail tubular protein A n=1 Tax=Caulobacter phage Lullwater TaxID=2024607 RepID=A0A291LB37_9CAUD|nr:tail protein [Caulobacter phage Lullwater]ATI16342.1 tail tubular protein A [Caulobacter phage Lullwater]